MIDRHWLCLKPKCHEIHKNGAVDTTAPALPYSVKQNTDSAHGQTS